MSQYFSKSKYFGGRVKTELNLSNYSKKHIWKNATGVDTSNFAKETDLADLKYDGDKLDIDILKNVPSGLKSLKSKVDKLDFDKLVPVPVALSKLSDVIKNDVVEKTECNAKIKDIDEKIPDITNLATNTTLNFKINEIKGKILSIINLAINSALNTKMNEVKGKIPCKSDLATTTAVFAVEVC